MYMTAFRCYSYFYYSYFSYSIWKFTHFILFIRENSIKCNNIDAERSMHCRILVIVSYITVILILYG